VCFYCKRSRDEQSIASREQALEWLGRLERCEGLRFVDALNVGAELLAWAESELSNFRCEEALSIGLSETRKT
jgi:hypothetical protein